MDFYSAKVRIKAMEQINTPWHWQGLNPRIEKGPHTQAPVTPTARPEDSSDTIYPSSPGYSPIPMIVKRILEI